MFEGETWQAVFFLIEDWYNIQQRPQTETKKGNLSEEKGFQGSVQLLRKARQIQVRTPDVGKPSEQSQSE